MNKRFFGLRYISLFFVLLIFLSFFLPNHVYAATANPVPCSGTSSCGCTATSQSCDAGGIIGACFSNKWMGGYPQCCINTSQVAGSNLPWGHQYCCPSNQATFTGYYDSVGNTSPNVGAQVGGQCCNTGLGYKVCSSSATDSSTGASLQACCPSGTSCANDPVKGAYCVNTSNNSNLTVTCSANQSSVEAGQSVAITVNITGGTAPYSTVLNLTKTGDTGLTTYGSSSGSAVGFIVRTNQSDAGKTINSPEAVVTDSKGTTKISYCNNISITPIAYHCVVGSGGVGSCVYGGTGPTGCTPGASCCVSPLTLNGSGSAAACCDDSTQDYYQSSPTTGGCCNEYIGPITGVKISGKCGVAPNQVCCTGNNSCNLATGKCIPVPNVTCTPSFQTIVAGNPFTVTATNITNIPPTNSAPTLIWTVPFGAVNPGDNKTHTYLSKAQGNFTFTVTATNNNVNPPLGSPQSTCMVTVVAPLTVTCSPSTHYVNLCDKTTVTANPSGGVPGPNGYSYTWTGNIPFTPAIPASNLNTQSISGVVYSASGTYTASVTVKDSLGNTAKSANCTVATIAPALMPICQFVEVSKIQKSIKGVTYYNYTIQAQINTITGRASCGPEYHANWTLWIAPPNSNITLANFKEDAGQSPQPYPTGWVQVGTKIAPSVVVVSGLQWGITNCTQVTKLPELQPLSMSSSKSFIAKQSISSFMASLLMPVLNFFGIK